MTKTGLFQAKAFSDGLFTGNLAEVCILLALVDMNCLDLIGNA